MSMDKNVSDPLSAVSQKTRPGPASVLQRKFFARVSLAFPPSCAIFSRDFGLFERHGGAGFLETRSEATIFLYSTGHFHNQAFGAPFPAWCQR